MERYEAIPQREIPSEKQLMQIKLECCEEELVDVGEMGEKRIWIDPVYFRRGYKAAGQKCYLRKQVYERLLKVLDLLEPEYGLKIYDGWRPYQLQLELYMEYYDKVRQEHPEDSEEELVARVRNFVSLPLTDKGRPYAHGTGGAVDLTICRADGSEIDMGTEFDDFSPRAATAYFESERGDIQIRDNRRWLYALMTSAGFTNLPSEWWHYDYEDRFYAYYKGRSVSAYGGILEHEENERKILERT